MARRNRYYFWNNFLINANCLLFYAMLQSSEAVTSFSLSKTGIVHIPTCYIASFSQRSSNSLQMVNFMNKRPSCKGKAFGFSKNRRPCCGSGLGYWFWIRLMLILYVWSRSVSFWFHVRENFFFSRNCRLPRGRLLFWRKLPVSCVS